MKNIKSLERQQNNPFQAGISSDLMKLIAVVSMCIDHLAVVVLKGYVNATLGEISQEQLKNWEMVYDWMRNIGRMAFPLFAFLLVEGFFHSKNLKKYGIRLTVAALLSEIPFNLALYGQIWSTERQNTIFSLLLGFVMLTILRELQYRPLQDNRKEAESYRVFVLQIGVIASMALLAYICRVDYTWKGILLMAVFYFFHGYRNASAIAGFCVFSGVPWSVLGFLLLPFYNGKRNGKGYLLYLFYPVHLLVLWGVLQMVLL